LGASGAAVNLSEIAMEARFARAACALVVTLGLAAGAGCGAGTPSGSSVGAPSGASAGAQPGVALVGFLDVVQPPPGGGGTQYFFVFMCQAPLNGQNLKLFENQSGAGFVDTGLIPAGRFTNGVYYTVQVQPPFTADFYLTVDAGGQTLVSNRVTASTTGAAGAISLTAPTRQQTGVSPNATFSWTGVNAAQDYLLVAAGAQSLLVVEYHGTSWTVAQQGASFFSGQVGDQLDSSSPYTAQVYALDGTGWGFAASAPVDFTTGP
jgi:hypothetical protein